MSLRVGVFGGNGFVGATVLRALVAKGHVPTSFSRTGTLPSQFKDESWARACAWEAADALNPSTYRDSLNELDAIVISLGSPPVPTFNQAAFEAQKRANGETCVQVINASNDAGIKQVVLVNAALTTLAPKGYCEGKVLASEAAKKFAEESEEHGATILYPSAIYGTRYTGAGMGVPLTPFLMPVSLALRGLETIGVSAAVDRVAPGLWVKSPISVESVAAAAVLGATDASFRGKLYEFDVDEMRNLRL